jgi:hypothetical protein
MTAHDGKRHVMVPEGQFMTENDTSCEGSFGVQVYLLSPQHSLLIY